MSLADAVLQQIDNKLRGKMKGLMPIENGIHIILTQWVLHVCFCNKK